MCSLQSGNLVRYFKLKIIKWIPHLFAILLTAFLVSCDGGLAPIEQEPDPFGVIIGSITYTGEWPPEEEFIQFFFVPLEFKPQTFLEVLADRDNLRPSDRLNYGVDEDTFVVDELVNGTYIYNVIANQFGPSPILNWRPLGVYTENDGVITVEGDTTYIHIDVDFNNLPPFPPD